MLSRDQILHAISRLDEELGRRGVHAELYLVGGAVMCLSLSARPATKDVDGWFTEPAEVRAAVSRVAEELELPDDWLDDAAKGFVPAGAVFERWKALPNLDIALADPETLLAMKCAAARTLEDADDIRVLADHLGLSTAEEVIAVALRFFPPERLPVRTQLLVEEIFS